MIMSTDPLKKYEIKPDLPPRHRLKNAGEALAPKSQQKINWLVFAIVGIALALAIITILVKLR